MSEETIEGFLYNNSPVSGFPDATLRIGVEFEAAGSYETWDWVVERKVYIQDGQYALRRIAAGRTLAEALAKARVKLIEEWKARDDVDKCWCGRKGDSLRTLPDGSQEWVCLGHGIVGNLGPDDYL